MAVADEDWTRKPVTPLGRLVPAITLSTLSFFIAVNTPMQLLLTLRLTEIAGVDDATTAFGVVSGVGALVAMVFNPIAGRISDRTGWRFGRRRTWVLAGAVAGALVLVALSVTTQVWQVVVLWCLVQGTLNFQYAATNALVADQVPPHRRGGVSGIAGLTVAIGPVAGLLIVNSAAAGSPLQWQLVAAVLVVGAAVAVALIRDLPAAPSVSDPSGPRGLRGLARMFWIDPRRHPAFGWAWLVRFLITCGYAASSYHAFYLIRRFGYSTDEVGDIVLRLSLVTVGLLAVSSVGAGYLSDRIKRQKPFVMLGGVLATAALLMMAFAPSLGFVYAAGAVLGLGTGTFFAVDLALCVRVLPSSADAGRDLAIINIANSLPQSLVPFLAPALLAMGGYPALFCTLAVLAMMGAIVAVRVPEIGQEHGGPPHVAPITRTP